MAGLNAKEARIFRITHIDNLPWILDNGLHAQNGDVSDPDYVGIGMETLIANRNTHGVGGQYGGTLSDYIPFYFTPHSIMMYNIHTGYNEVKKRDNEEIAILVSSIPRLAELTIPFVFTNAHAYTAEAEFFESPSDLDRIDWALLRSKDFKRDPEDPGKQGRYQAEALVYQFAPIDALLGIACYNKNCKESTESLVQAREHSLSVKSIPGWYFA